MKFPSYQTKEEIPEGLVDFYVEKDGKWVPEGIEGDTTADRITEFRNNNVALRQEKEALEAKLASIPTIDPDRLARLEEIEQRIQGDEEAKLISEGKMDEVLARRTDAMRDEHKTVVTAKDELIGALTGERDTFRTELTTLRLNGELDAALAAKGYKLKPGAAPDAYRRTHERFEMNNEGVTQAKKGVYGADTNPLGMEEHVAKLAKEAGFLFESSQGGGSEGGVPPSSTAARVVDSNDPMVFGKNLDAIADGKVEAIPGGGV